ncbi:hypothetical protein [Amycolatopsis alkalitolerans]|uniref:Uncharacterized protein n=1 Tax=Amycolatopsis alkalitolerans TaxID=2547244 RepID=A0A5C4M4B7_9PSEU|nr:hypothetical protein [Amycolatopsis alkalitolerans]TNC27409.1 hypothetical protein FG385_10085 [Amycolatopsis alkalitolerans]
MTEENPPEEPQPPKPGSMRFQDADSTKPREPTLAEQRARRKALAEEQEREAAEAEAEQRAATRRKVMIGSGVTVGLVGVVAAWYLVGTPNTVNAVCTDANGVVQNDEYCDDAYIASHGGHYDTVSGLWIIPYGVGAGQYRYNYGGTGAIGTRVSGGSFTKPSGNTTVKTSAGKTVQRGGFGISGKSGGIGKSGGS